MKHIQLILCALLGTLSYFTGKAQINAYAKVTSISGKVLSLSNVNQTYHTFATGEQVIIIQMQDNVIATTTNTSLFGTIGSIGAAGKYEVGTIGSITTSFGTPVSITLTGPPGNTYNTSAAVQIVSFNSLATGNYTLATALTGVAWNGSVGGVVAFQVGGTLTMNKSVSADGIGFRGGALSANYEVQCEPNVYDTTSGNYGYKGEGIEGPAVAYGVHTGRGPLASGGGGGSDDNGGGGGGGNYTAGGTGGPGWTCTATDATGGLGGLALGLYVSGGRVFMGGGGGSGQQNNGVGSAGSAGGGIVFIKANQLTTSCTGSVSVTAAGVAAASSGNDGAGGAGAAGTVVMAINSFSVSSACPLTVAAIGGGGGNVTDPNSHGGGGGGGQGAIIYSAALPTANITTTTQAGAGGNNSSSGTSTASSGAGSPNSGVQSGTPVVLPVTFLSFSGQKSGQEDVLSWVTSKTLQPLTFTVQRSTDGQTFEDLASVAWLSDGGATETYVWYDAAPQPSYNYYRIREQDMAGEIYYSSVVVLDWGAVSAFRLWPNPTHGSFSVFVDADASVTVADMSGSIVYRRQLTSSGGRIDVVMPAPVTAGVYMIRVETKSSVQTGKLLVL